MSAAALRRGAAEAAGVPAAVLAAGYLGFGALAAAHGVPVAFAVAATALIWALPAQIILLEMDAMGAPLVATALTVVLSSARFLPMTLMLMPLMRDERHRRWHYYFAAQVLALTGWTMAVARFPALARADRLPWFVGFALVCIGSSMAAAAAGYLVADHLTPLARSGLVFMAPMYYVLILAGGVRDRRAGLGLAFGAVAGPLAYLASPEWSVLAGGLVGGTAAWLVTRGGARHG